ncbi:MAG TPA: SH3 domain-containing protein [Eubacteriaceae bacterium]|nr:SH3 domain-containing protein [Eubacteriaceae bacterium]
MDFKKQFIKFIILSSLIVFVVMILPLEIDASGITYNVYNLKIEGKDVVFGKSLLSTSNFENAKAEMKKYPNGIITSSNSPSPLKIVAATRGQAQSFPYREGKHEADDILLIYSDKRLSSDITYIPAHYMMYVYDYFEEGGRIVADIEVQGGRGYVDVAKTDIIPMIYIENGISISLGGKAVIDPSINKVYSVVPHQEEYRVTKSGSVNEISVHLIRPYPGLARVNLTYGIAPDFLEVGKTYYSPDGIRFYTDRDLTQRAGNQNYYSYFQWLPLRSGTNHKAEAFENLLKYYGKNDSVMLGETHHFIEQGLKYGMNPVLIFQQANLESAYGTSTYAINRNNVFGWGAVDSDPDQAYTYPNIGEGIAIHMNSQIAGYMKISDWRHSGPSFGNKSAGITVRYASDPYYGIKVASLYYTMDKLNGYKDYNAYKLSLLEDGERYSVKRLSDNIQWYRTKAGLRNQVIINLERKDNKIKTIPWMTNSDGFLNINSDFAYIEDPNSKIIDIDSQGKFEMKYEKPVKAKTTANLNLRLSYSTASGVILTIPKGTVLDVELTNIGWARTRYNGREGYVSMDYLDMNVESSPGELKYRKGDVNGDGTINSADYVQIANHILGNRKLSGASFVAADINGDDTINSADFVALANHILGRKLIQ